MWEDLILKAKDGGIDVIETYVFWNVHEPTPGNVLLFSLLLVLFLWFFFCFGFSRFIFLLCLDVWVVTVPL